MLSSLQPKNNHGLAFSSLHNTEIYENRRAWARKPVLRQVYADFYRQIARHLSESGEEYYNLELGSGMGNIKEFIPNCITSDIFPNPWLDRVENAYKIDLPDARLANLIMFDVWHHLAYPANALAEAARVLKPGGRLLVFDPAMTPTGRLVYGLFHHEPLAFNSHFQQMPVDLGDFSALPYFAAQSSAHRLLVRRECPDMLMGWNTLQQIFITSFAYLASGGFRGRQLYPDSLLPVVRAFDRLLAILPSLFAARLLIVMEKPAH
jgi:SAM-dependent methyltransferase